MKQPFLCLPLLLLAAAGCGDKAAVVPSARYSSPPSPFSMGADLQKRGVMSSADWAHLTHISYAIEREQKVSDQDLSSWIALLHRGPLKDYGLNRLQFETLILSGIDGRKKLTPPQQEKLYDAILPYVSEPDGKFPALYGADISPKMREDLLAGNQRNAIHLLATTRNPKALTVLARLAKDSKRAAVRREAQRDHDQLQQVLSRKP